MYKVMNMFPETTKYVLQVRVLNNETRPMELS